MKIVIFEAFGGWFLSHEAIMLYAKYRGIDLHWITHHTGIRLYATDEITIVGEEIQIHNGQWFNPLSDLARNDEILVRVVEELGEAANGDLAKLKIVEIPDGVEWELGIRNGKEIILEKHRSWS